MSGISFLQRIFSSIFGGNDPEAEKKRLLRSIAKDLSRAKFHYYKTGSKEIEPSLPKFFYEVYKAVHPAQVMFQNTPPATLKNSTIDFFLTQKQHQLYEQLSDAAIENLTHTQDVKSVAAKTRKDLEDFNSDFGNGNSEKIDNTYNLLMLFKNFCSYDFYFLLRKFDSSLREGAFTVTPRFQPINSTYIADDLKNFLEVAWAIPFDADWTPMFQMLKGIKGVEPIAPANWKKIVSRLKILKNSRVFEMMIQLITEDPSYSERGDFTDEHIVEPFITQLDKQVKTKLEQVQQQETSSKVDNLVEQIFGDKVIEHLRNYNVQESTQLERKGITGFLYCIPLTYTKEFLIEYVKTELRELSDILLVRGKWTNSTLSVPMSEAYNNLLELSNKIFQFDATLAEDAETGQKIKNLIPRGDKGNDSSILAILLRDVNDAAYDILRQVQDYLIIYARNLKALLEDYCKLPRSEMIINWKELEKFSEQDLKTMSVNAYKKIYLFVTLLQSFPVKTI